MKKLKQDVIEINGVALDEVSFSLYRDNKFKLIVSTENASSDYMEKLLGKKLKIKMTGRNSLKIKTKDFRIEESSLFSAYGIRPIRHTVITGKIKPKEKQNEL